MFYLRRLFSSNTSSIIWYLLHSRSTALFFWISNLLSIQSPLILFSHVSSIIYHTNNQRLNNFQGSAQLPEFFEAGAVEQQTTFQPGDFGRDILDFSDGLPTLWWKIEDEGTQGFHGHVEQ